MQVSQANTEAALGELRLRLEAHQRMLARWEAKVARQLEKIVGLQKNASRKISTESAPATPFPGLGKALTVHQQCKVLVSPVTQQLSMPYTHVTNCVK